MKILNSLLPIFIGFAIGWVLIEIFYPKNMFGDIEKPDKKIQEVLNIKNAEALMKIGNVFNKLSQQANKENDIKHELMYRDSALTYYQKALIKAK